jgi:hypothetical protein
VDAAAGPSGGATRGTRARTGMARPGAAAIAVIVPRPFGAPRADRGLGGMTPPVARPGGGVPPRAASRQVVREERTARRQVRVVAPPDALLPGITGTPAEAGGPLGGLGAGACAFLGASTWRSAGIAMGRACVPRRAGRVPPPHRRDRSARRVARWRAGGLARADAPCAAVCVIPPTCGLRARWGRLAPSHAAGVAAGLGGAESWPSRCGAGA